jgi:hypothetical protein
MMETNDHVPAEVFSLAEYLANEMQVRGWTAIDVARRMPGDYAMNICVVNLTLAVQDDSLLLDDVSLHGLATAFNVDPTFFANLHATWLNNPNARAEFKCPEELLTGMIFPEPSSRPLSPMRGE